jgi:septal ring factor EnvC (AmiA/AmiB activator)
VAAPTNSERIEANVRAIRSVERAVAVHEQRIETLDGEVGKLAEELDSTGELAIRIDERLKHLERSVDRIWKLLLTLVVAVVIEVVRRILMGGQ